MLVFIDAVNSCAWYHFQTSSPINKQFYCRYLTRWRAATQAAASDCANQLATADARHQRVITKQKVQYINSSVNIITCLMVMLTFNSSSHWPVANSGSHTGVVLASLHLHAMGHICAWKHLFTVYSLHVNLTFGVNRWWKYKCKACKVSQAGWGKCSARV
jgi:hypothetical protein